jgi:hypothetical protein
MKSRAVWTIVTLSLLFFVQLGEQSVLAQSQDQPSTSSTATVQQAAVGRTVDSDEATEPITFNEFPLRTAISDQYANRGILFRGDNPFISIDGSNPTSPVLSGSPQFRGDIEGRFVNPADGVTPVVVESFTLDAGFFDELASTRLEWFDPNGQKLGQRTNTILGIEQFTIKGGNIASWRMSIIKTEPAGYAVDNISFTPIQASVLFRELDEGDKEGTWEGSDEQIPGFDHVGLHVNNLVYESHPGYPEGTECVK